MKYLLLSFLIVLEFWVIPQSKTVLQTIKTVCIDAGHGGKDPGCHGSSANEKTVCLSMALQLGAKIKENFPNIKVIYTRETDVFVELEDRANFANKNNADLFICIHANAGSTSAYGSETYALGLHKTEAQQKVAERENSTILMEDDKGERYKRLGMTPDAIIARQLQLSVVLKQSLNFADKLQQEFKKIGRYDRGVKQAGFLVLWQTTMPSVLIETGFLTNPQEEVLLANKEFQNKMSDAMFFAFKKYKSEMEGLSNSVIEENNTNQEEIKNSNDNSNTVPNNDIIFRVQIETSDKRISLTDTKFKGLEVFEYTQDNLYKYAVGQFENNFNSANAYKNELREKGFLHAFVIAFHNNERIPIDKALKMIKP
ncbi:MAG: N-acetylmuramoyl-L-alanine amidase [Flavobacteriia bacterium]|nr:N-acetylmuramoyl-L-alanine amidase [Flavobacteriia bacterium]